MMVMDLTVSTHVWNTDQPEFIFPSVEERVQFYMGSWYDFHDNHNITVHNETIHIRRLICDKSMNKGYANSRLVYSTKPTIYPFDVLLHRNKMTKHWTASYLKDATNVMTYSDTSVQQEYHDEKYVILSSGDDTFEDRTKPIVFKARKIIKSVNGSHRPIIWPLRMDRHFHGPLNELQTLVRDGNDTKWEDKKNVLHWRGTGNTNAKGTRAMFAKKFGDVKEMDNMTIGLYTINSESKSQFNLTRCTYCVKPKQDMKTMLQYKYLLSIEGNDVATDLKWKLASSSVVFMPEPVIETYAMESKLIPYVHYIPVKEDGSDLLKQLQWAQDNDEKCRWISEQATKYMDKLYYSDQAKIDYLLIRYRLATLYQEKFGKALAKCYKS